MSEFSPDIQERQKWMAVLARCKPDELEARFNSLSNIPDWTYLRKPETGMVMVRGRAGGTGQRFNVGETTLTRTTVRLNSGQQGFGYVMGKNKRHSELAAILDGMLQDASHTDTVKEKVIQPLKVSVDAEKTERSRKAASTKVEFFTMVRGD